MCSVVLNDGGWPSQALLVLAVIMNGWPILVFSSIWSSTCLCSVVSGIVLVCVQYIWSSAGLCSVVSGLVLACVQ